MRAEIDGGQPIQNQNQQQDWDLEEFLEEEFQETQQKTQQKTQQETGAQGCIYHKDELTSENDTTKCSLIEQINQSINQSATTTGSSDQLLNSDSVSIAALVAILSKLKEELEKASILLNTTDNQIEGIQGQIAQLNLSNEEMQQQQADLENKTKSEIKQAKADEKNDLNNNTNKYNNQIDKNKEAYDNSVNNAKDQYNNTMDGAQKKVDDAQKEADDSKSALNQANKELAKAQAAYKKDPTPENKDALDQAKSTQEAAKTQNSAAQQNLVQAKSDYKTTQVEASATEKTAFATAQQTRTQADASAKADYEMANKIVKLTTELKVLGYQKGLTTALVDLYNEDIQNLQNLGNIQQQASDISKSSFKENPLLLFIQNQRGDNKKELEKYILLLEKEIQMIGDQLQQITK